MRIRFSVRTLLVFVTAFGILLTWYHYHTRLVDARYAFGYAEAKYSVATMSGLQLCKASQQLLNVESSTPWISDEQAELRHRKVVDRVLYFMENQCTMGPDPLEDKDFQSELQAIRNMATDSKPVADKNVINTENVEGAQR